MKLLLTTIMLAIGGTTLAFTQTASDYYFQLHVGNFWRFHTNGTPSGWSARTTIESVDRIDSIAGKEYFAVVGREFSDDTPADTNIFHCFWVREDSIGNILLGAYAIREVDIDSAIFFHPPVPFFPNDFLTVGYFWNFVDTIAGMRYQDSVVSTNETVISSAGTFTNCLKIRSQQKDSLGNLIHRDYSFYAQGVGVVKSLRELPADEAHENDLVQYALITAIDENTFTHQPHSFALEQNYPNPFNAVTEIRYQIPEGSYVTLKVFDVLGREVATIVNGVGEPGYTSVKWDASNVSSGMYFYRLRADSFIETNKLLLLK